MKSENPQVLINAHNPSPTATLSDLSVDELRQAEVKGGQTTNPGIGILKSSDGGRTW